MFEIEIKEVERKLGFLVIKGLEETGASPSICNFFLSAVGRQEFNIVDFNCKADESTFDDVILIIRILKYDYHKIIEYIQKIVIENEKKFVEISLMKGL